MAVAGVWAGPAIQDALAVADSTKSNTSSDKLAADAAGTFATRLVVIVFSLASGIITARALGPENRGIFSLVALFPATLITLSKFGQSQATIYHIKREHDDVAQVASNVLLFALAVGLALIAMVVLFREQLVSTLLNGVPVWALLLMTPIIPVLLIESYLYAVLQATDRFKVYNTRLFAEAVLTLAAFAWTLLAMGWGLPGALGAVITVRLAMVSWVVWTIHADSAFRLHFDFGLFKRMIRYGLKSHVQIIASHFHFKAGLYIVAYYLSPTQVAFFSIAARLAERIMYIPQSLALALFPRLAGSETEQVHLMTAKACRQTLVVTSAAALFLSVVGKFAIVFFYGEDYADAAVPLPYVSWGVVMMSMYVLLSRNFTSRGRQFINIIAAYVALCGNLGLNFMLVPELGIRGAAIATASSYTLAAFILFGFFLWESRLPWHEALVLRRSDLVMWRHLFNRFVVSRLGRAGGWLGPGSGGDSRSSS